MLGIFPIAFCREGSYARQKIRHPRHFRMNISGASSAPPSWFIILNPFSIISPGTFGWLDFCLARGWHSLIDERNVRYANDVTVLTAQAQLNLTLSLLHFQLNFRKCIYLRSYMKLKHNMIMGLK